MTSGLRRSGPREPGENGGRSLLAFLSRFGRCGIPIVAVYGPGLPRGQALPELLTPATPLAAIVRAERESPDKITTDFLP